MPAIGLVGFCAAACTAAFPPTAETVPLSTAIPVSTFVDMNDSAQQDIPPPASTDFPIPEKIPTVDTSLHSVSPQDIYFDTFRSVNRAVPLSVAQPALILQLQDAIPPIHEPVYEPGESASWLDAGDRVVGYASGQGAWAYPVRILNFHEIVNDTLDEEPILISYCPLCFSGIVYSRELDGEVLTFGNTSALYESDMVMLDYQTGSYWWQVAGSAIVGPLTGKSLEVLPSQTATWETWLRLHPDTLVLSRETGFARDYSRDPFASLQDSINRGRFAFPVSEAGLDGRLLPGEIVIAVRIGDSVRAYPLMTAESGVISDQVEDQPIVIFVDSRGPDAGVYVPVLDDLPLTFQYTDADFVDDQTGSKWDLSGTAVSGDLEGKNLMALPSKTSFWYAIVAAEPEISVYTP